ncbi:hypothetical protein HERIO_2395 [Hepatospora eriocheir]|uniref:Uncharacterized protein n=1 Tax=Hepatospora eriocheir TaxID=1081669 RepID=A0A1X0Q726_9MICR|nr:hypothetical protein HERIO_2395 [Hepatospora eriocheir]
MILKIVYTAKYFFFFTSSNSKKLIKLSTKRSVLCCSLTFFQLGNDSRNMIKKNNSCIKNPPVISIAVLLIR